MSLYSRVIGVYERFTVLSVAAIRQEVQMLVGTPSGMTPPRIVQEVCKLLVKGGEWQRAFVVMDALPQEQRQTLMTTLELSPPRSHGTQPEHHVVDISLADKLREMTSEALLKLGFSLQRPQYRRGRVTFHDVEEMTTEEKEIGNKNARYNEIVQRQLFFEFRRRRQYKELMQCVMNWRSKGLIGTRRVAKGHIEGNNSSERKSFTHCTEYNSKDPISTRNATPFNVEEALRGLIFNSSSPGSQWEEVLKECPEFFMSTLREPTAALQFLRKTTVEVLIRFTISLLRGNGTVMHSRPECGVAWETVASLCFALRPYLAREKKTVKTDLLQALLHALRSEAMTTNVNKPGMRQGVSSMTISDGRSQAMQSAVEGICASLAQHNEAQARFIGLPLFIEISVALRDCGVQVPNSLLQCVFLCLGDTQRYQWSETSSSSSSSQLGSSMPNEQEPLVNILNSSPEDRWIPALRLLHMCSEQGSFVVNAAHLHSLLGGMQSISITRTWQTALYAAQLIMERYHIFPNETTVEKLMLNLHAASWKRSFEVLQLYTKNHILPSPLIMRDLHVVAMKHSSWDVVLRVMQQIEETGPKCAGFMNYVYCLRAYGCAGKWKEAATLFQDLKNKPGTVSSGRPVYNEVTVAVPVMGMMEYGHWECVVQFVMEIYRQCAAELTQEGMEVALAAKLLALMHIGDLSSLGSFLNKHSGDEGHVHNTLTEGDVLSPSVAGLRIIVQRAAQLYTLRGMEHFNAPIRLVFDVIATCKDEHYYQHHAEKFGPTTRGRITQKPLYLLPHHVQTQHEKLAVMFGKMVRRDESLFGAATQQAVAEAMSSIGAGPAYLKAALL